MLASAPLERAERIAASTSDIVGVVWCDLMLGGDVMINASHYDIIILLSYGTNNNNAAVGCCFEASNKSRAPRESKHGRDIFPAICVQ